MRSAGLILDKPIPFGDYLGCGQKPIGISREEARKRLEHGDQLRTGDRCTGTGEPDARSPTDNPIRAIRYGMKGFHAQVVDTYLNLSKQDRKSLKTANTPNIDDHHLAPEDFEEKGDLANDAAKIVMKALYGARFLRYDLLWPISSCASRSANGTAHPIDDCIDLLVTSALPSIILWRRLWGPT